MIDLGTLKITIDTGANDAKKELTSFGDTVQQQESKINKTMSNIAKGVVAAFSVNAIVNFGKKAVEASANLQAMEAQFDQVFKGDENINAVERINAQVEDLGINADRLTDSWNKFGGQIKGAGMEGEQALDAVDKATRLAADSAAFYDRSLEDSTASLASFMKGNFAAGDAIGVFTNAKQMDVKANEMYGKSWADLTESERQWLLLDTVEKTYEMNGAMGQASREAGAYENVMGNLRATFERFYATIGEPVLEIFLGVVQNVTSWIESNMPVIETTVTEIFEGIKWVWENVLSPVLSILFDMLTGVFGFVQENWPTISIIFSTVFDAIKFIWDKVLSPVLDAILSILSKIVKYIGDNFPSAQGVVEKTFGAIGTAVKTLTDIFWGIVSAIQAAIEWLKSWNNTEAKDKKTTWKSGRDYDGSHANGLSYVPFDGYIAQLHQGERVLTADENRAYPGANEKGFISIIEAIQSLERTLIDKNMTAVIDKDDLTDTVIDGVRDRTIIYGESPI
ncbi:hypothetical protein HZF24_04480 [Sedimentibacter hydroxybenzoicus DSM 7310]|uniref:Uncharacterized protein n=1 Tax=Sedimentibacter hydroxybenzoicus DSM 7310 TaxID=1123245 RepID=A0A974BHU3_SEDHY|nr:hypothetical protein [Sedimentibacter hydroxybenzoicus]NYB73392.1 hypothetical protein [Sedimentibacter hydroxybenzoicus DSM 7310]